MRRARLRGPLRPTAAVPWAIAVAAAGFAALAYIYLTLPDVRVLAGSNPATTAFIELRAGEAHARGHVPRRDQRWVSYERISGHLKRAVLVAEDDAFWQHEGVDFAQIKESLEHDLEQGRMVRGGSTITQQLAKNLYLSPSRNPIRKLRELFIARRLEAELSKRRILEIYLNVVEWGDGIYGAEAASRTYFRKPASQVGPGEAALLAAALVNPRVLAPGRPTARLLRRQRLILGRMGGVTPPPTLPLPVPVPVPAPSETPSSPVAPAAGLPPAAPAAVQEEAPPPR
jgi:monofunctional biosynthetic peptidoglycan transglycosylase